MNNSNKNIFSLKNTLFFFLVSAAFFYEALLRSCTNAIYHLLEAAPYYLTPIQIGSFASNFFFSYAISQLFVGYLLDRLGPRRVLLAGLSILVFACLMMLTHSYPWLLAARALMGLAAAGLFLSGAYFIQTYFDSRHAGLLLGIYIGIGFFGGFAANYPFLLLVQTLQLKGAWILMALLGVLLAIGVYFNGKILPLSQAHMTASSKEKMAFSSRKIIFIVALMGVAAGLVDISTGVFGSLWGTKFLHATQHLTLANASWISSLVFIGYMCGCPCFGWYFSRGNRLFYRFSVAALLMAALFIGLTYFIWSAFLLASGIFALGFLASSNIFAFRLPYIYWPANGGMLLAWANFIVMSINSLFQLFVPAVYQYTQSAHTANSIFIFASISAFLLAIYLQFMTKTANLHELSPKN